MTHKELCDLRKLLTEVIHGEDCHILSDFDLNNLKFSVDRELEKCEIETFIKHVEDAMPVDDDDDAWDTFYRKFFTIMFDGKCCNIPVEATSYQSIVDTLKEYLVDTYGSGATWVRRSNMRGRLVGVKVALNRLYDADIDADGREFNASFINGTMAEIIDDLIAEFK